MASRISQMRNAQQMQSQTQQSLNESIAATRALMSRLKIMSNPQAELMKMIQQNPKLLSIVQRGNLEEIAKQMAQINGFDINSIINQLSGGI